MELIETLRNIVVREGFEAGHSIQDISDETGLPVLEVFQREKDLHLIPANEAFACSCLRYRSGAAHRLSTAKPARPDQEPTDA